MNFFRQKKEVLEGCKFQLDSIIFSGGDSINLSADDIVVLVGANNVGKTATLKEIVAGLEGKNGRTVTSVKIRKQGGEDNMMALLTSRTKFIQNSYRGWGAWISGDYNAKEAWKKPKELQELTHVFCRFVGTEERLSSSHPVDNINIALEAITSGMQQILASPDDETRLSETVSSSFGVGVFLDRWSGKQVFFRIGEKPTGKEWSPEFIEELNKRPLLQVQGDGIRSFVGCFMEGVLPPHEVVLVDEPEAFLHPHHARILGKALAREKPDKRQLFIATHSLHMLLGLLDSGKPVRVVRIRRDGDSNPVQELSSTEISELWQDPLLRSSNVLQGLFHEMVVVCEGDSDCRFYSSVLERLIETNKNLRQDVFFIHVGGKQRVPVAVKALRGLGVNVRAAVDFDVLNDAGKMQNILAAFGASWDEIKKPWQALDKTVRERAKTPTVTQVREAIDQVLANAQEEALTSSEKRQIAAAVNKKGGWDDLKLSGKEGIPSGEPQANFARVNDFFLKHGVHIVPCGELERFDSSFGGHGPKWVNKVLTKDLASSPELSSARDYVMGLVSDSVSKETD